jgi:hypothetical protein
VKMTFQACMPVAPRMRLGFLLKDHTRRELEEGKPL